LATDKKPAYIKYENNRMMILTPTYEAGWVSEIKAELKTRKWNPKTKEWVIDIKERIEALRITNRFFTVIEDNQPPAMTETETTEVEILKPEAIIKSEWMDNGHIDIWVDGACVGNPGPGGYGVLFRCKDKPRVKSGGYKLTTNNRMEIMAVIVALRSLEKKTNVTIYSDSKYVVDAISQGWAKKWKANGWMRNNKEAAVNPDLWEILLTLCYFHKVEFKWVKGHNNHKENELCDRLAENASRHTNLLDDLGYRR
jgi:ribonuclease HI